MGMLAFFPWFRIADSTQVAEFELIAFDRDEYEGPHAEAVRVLTAPYKEHRDRSISGATLLRFADRDLLADLEEDERGAAFLFAEFLALAGLSARRFFSQDGYANRDNFGLIIQRFTEPGK